MTDPEVLRLASYFVVVAFGAAFNSKFLAVSVVYAIALLASAAGGWADFVMVFYVPALLLAGFRG